MGGCAKWLGKKGVYPASIVRSGSSRPPFAQGSSAKWCAIGISAMLVSAMLAKALRLVRSMADCANAEGWLIGLSIGYVAGGTDDMVVECRRYSGSQSLDYNGAAISILL